MVGSNEAKPKMGAPSEAKLEKMKKDILENNMLPKDAIGIPDNVMEGIYANGYQLYNSGQYRDAATLFRLLVMLNAMEPKYALGLAACHHLQGQYDNALMTYAIVSSLAPNDPMPNYHAADCYLQVGMKELALEQMQIALNRCGNDPHYTALKNRIIVTIGALVKQISDQKKGASEEKKEAQVGSPETKKK